MSNDISRIPSTTAGPSRKRRRSPMTFVPALPSVSGALSLVRANLIPSPKRVRDSGYLADVEVDRIDARVVVEAVDQEESETGARGPVEVGVERVTHPAMPEDIPEPAQEGVVEVTYETLGDLVQRFHDHTKAIPVHRIQVIEGVQSEQGHWIVGVESAVTALTERIAELESWRGITGGSEAPQMEAREAAMNLGPLNENGDEQEGGNRENGNGGNRGNGNGGNGENGNGNRNGNHGMNYRGFMPVAQECTFQDFLKCKPHNFSGTEGVELILLCTRMVSDEEDRVERFIRGLPDNIQGNVIAANPARLQDVIRIANQLMDKLQGVLRIRGGWKCGRPRHVKRECPKLRNQNHRNRVGNKTGNQTGGNEATSKAYAIGGGGTNPDSNVVMVLCLMLHHLF
ncbi:hypothetical protein Tco_1024979 [Tanacetum coccineum]